MKNQVDPKVEYENDAVVIKNYAYLFNSFSPILLFFVALAIFIVWKYVKVLALNQGDIKYSFYASIVGLLLFFQVFIQRIRSFKKQPPTFLFTKNSIVIDMFVDNYKYRNRVKKNIKNISNVQYILNSEIWHQYGRINKKSLIKRFFNDDIGDVFIQVVGYFLSLTNLLVSFPIKLFILLKNGEPIYLLFKNFLIEFDNKTACVVNIYTAYDYNKIVQILKNNDIKINNNLKTTIYLKQKK